jgi:hypothetical protein
MTTWTWVASAVAVLGIELSLSGFQEANPEALWWHISPLRRPIKKRVRLEFTTHSGEFSVVPNSPPEPRTIFIFKVFLKFLLRNMDYYCSADAVFIKTVKVFVFL